jgi:Transmembrane secretion effector
VREVRVGYLRLLRRGHVLGLWVSETFSVFGDRFFTLALAWLAWERSGAMAMGLVVVAESIPHLLIGAFGRRLVGWFASFRRLAFIEIVQVAVVAGLPVLWHQVGIAAVFAVIVVIGTCDAITGPALAGLVPDLVEPDRVHQVTGLMDLTGRLTWVVGPASAGLLLTVMPAQGLFLIDAATFVVSAAAFGWLGRMPLSSAAGAPARPRTSPAGVAPAVCRVLCDHPRIGCALVLGGIGEFCQAVFAIGIPILLTVRLHAGLSAYGLVISAVGAGSLCGNLIAGHVRLPGRFPASYSLVWALRGAGLVGFAVAQTLGQVLAVTVLVSVLAPATAIGFGTELARLPMPQRLRMSSLNLMGSHVAVLASMLVVPELIVAAPVAAFTVAGAVTVTAGLLVWAITMVPAVRRSWSRQAEGYART